MIKKIVNYFKDMFDDEKWFINNCKQYYKLNDYRLYMKKETDWWILQNGGFEFEIVLCNKLAEVIKKEMVKII